MVNKRKVETQELNLNKIFYGFIVLAILILASIGFMFYSTSNLNNKIDSINKSLELESEDHFIQVQSNIGKSVVMVLSSPVHNDSGTNDVIYLDDKGQAWNLGTGFSIDDKGDILTANHVVRNASTVLILYQNNSVTMTIPVTGSKNFPDLDLAILYTKSSITPVRLQNSLSYVGASVAFAGFPLSTQVNGKNIPVETVIKGSVSGLVPFTYQDQVVPVYVLGGTANKGNSGGPVFSLKTGEVIGIINEKIMGTKGIAISTAINQNLINNLMNLPTPS